MPSTIDGSPFNTSERTDDAGELCPTLLGEVQTGAHSNRCPISEAITRMIPVPTMAFAIPPPSSPVEPASS
jgi:hypothetical protein